MGDIRTLRVATLRLSAADGILADQVELPGGVEVVDVRVRNPIPFDSATSATLKVGTDGDDDGLVTGTNVKTANVAPTKGADFTSRALRDGLRAGRVGRVSALVTTVGATTAGEVIVDILFAA